MRLVTAAGDDEGSTDLAHLLGACRSDKSPQFVLPDGEQIAQVDAGGPLEPFFDAELYFGGGATKSGCDRRDGDGM